MIMSVQRLSTSACLIVGLVAAAMLTSAVATASESRLDHAGEARHYRVVTPDTGPFDGGWPLVLVLHGGGGQGSRIERFSGFSELAERAGFVAAYPDALEGHWNDGRSDTDFVAQQRDVDDVGFLLALVDRLAADLPIDRNRVYAVGASNGGMMVQRLACDAAGHFAALASVIANLPEPLSSTCRPAAPVPMLIMNGTADLLMPWSGGPVGRGRQARGRVIGAEATAEFWARANECEARPLAGLLPDLAPDDGVTVRLARWQRCVAGSEVAFYGLEGGGHRWPGRDDRLGRLATRLLGPAAMDIDGTAEIWAFFQRHALGQ